MYYQTSTTLEFLNTLYYSTSLIDKIRKYANVSPNTVVALDSRYIIVFNIFVITCVAALLRCIGAGELSLEDDDAPDIEADVEAGNSGRMSC